MTEPKFRIGDIVYAPDSIGKNCFQVLARKWDVEYAEWIYYGAHPSFIYDEAHLRGPETITK